MKNLSSHVEGVWVERVSPTELQLQTLKNGTEEEKQALISVLHTTPAAADIAIANELYNQHKPTDDNYSLISCGLTIGEEIRGIINYRINSDHKQIRF